MSRHIGFFFSLLLLFTLAASAAEKSSGAQKDENAGKMVDQGTFAIFQMGQRVATEDFTIRQYSDHNVTSSRLRMQGAPAPGQPTSNLDQTSQLTLLPDGSLSRYEWKQASPVARSAVVEAKDNVLVMHSIAVNGTSSDHTFFLTPAAFVLDDYDFAVREVLLWRYLATSCQPRATGEGCDLVRARFPVLIPLRRTSGEVFVEFKGYDDTPLNGKPQHLRHFVIQSDGPEWNVWLDEDQKLLRMSVPSASTEVLRQ